MPSSISAGMTDWNGPVHGQEAPSVCRRLRTVGPVTRRYLIGIALSPKPKKILTTKVTKSMKPTKKCYQTNRCSSSLSVGTLKLINSPVWMPASFM